MRFSITVVQFRCSFLIGVEQFLGIVDFDCKLVGLVFHSLVYVVVCVSVMCAGLGLGELQYSTKGFGKYFNDRLRIFMGSNNYFWDLVTRG